MQIETLYKLLSSLRLNTSTEVVMQEQLHDVLKNHFPEVVREAKLDEGSRIDFLVGEIGIELKIKGRPKDIYRQIQRYCDNDKISQIILLTSKSFGLPETINGKPVYVIVVGRAWL